MFGAPCILLNGAPIQGTLSIKYTFLEKSIGSDSESHCQENMLPIWQRITLLPSPAAGEFSSELRIDPLFAGLNFEIFGGWSLYAQTCLEKLVLVPGADGRALDA